MAVVNEGSFTQAAMQLNVTQPNVSHAINKLEENLGHRVFKRDTTGTKVTDEGMELYNKVTHAIVALDQLSFSNETPDKNEFLLNELPATARDNALSELRESLTEEELFEVYPVDTIKFDRFGKVL